MQPLPALEQQGQAIQPARQEEDPELRGRNETATKVSSLFQSVAEAKRRTSLFAAVFSSRKDLDRRKAAREVWSTATRRARALRVSYRFILCDAPDGLEAELEAEDVINGDLLVLACDEGYNGGRLSQKVLTSMQTYLHSFSGDHGLFMKVDDDAFLAWTRLGTFIAQHAGPLVYMGVPLKRNKPCRNESSRWYESYETYPHDNFPNSMAGGTGYTLGSELVRFIVESGLANENLLNNEDRGTGLWVDRVKQDLGIQPQFISIPGTDWWDWQWGWSEAKRATLTWAGYEPMTHHGLSAQEVRCLAAAEDAQNPQEPIAGCFPKDPTVLEREGCWSADASNWFARGRQLAQGKGKVANPNEATTGVDPSTAQSTAASFAWDDFAEQEQRLDAAVNIAQAVLEEAKLDEWGTGMLGYKSQSKRRW